MHLLATDRMSCPRCGPDFGLILLADRLEERRVLEGHLGCANCREQYPVRSGFGDLRPPPRSPLVEPPPPPSDDPEGALRTAAFLGVTEGPGFLFLSGEPAGRAERIAAMVAGIEVIAEGEALRSSSETPGVSRILAGATLPFHSGSLRGAAIDGVEGFARLGEVARVLAVGARLVIHRPAPGTRTRLEEGGFDIILASESVVVAIRP